MQRAITMSMMRWEEAARQEEVDAAKALDALVAEQSKKNPDDWGAYDVWVEPSLRDPLDAYASAVWLYQSRVELRWMLVRDSWAHAKEAQMVSGGAVPAPDYSQKRAWDERATHGLFEVITQVREARQRFQEALDSAVNEATTPPGIKEVFLGGRPPPAPPPPPRESELVERRLTQALADAGAISIPFHWRTDDDELKQIAAELALPFDASRRGSGLAGEADGGAEDGDVSDALPFSNPY